MTRRFDDMERLAVNVGLILEREWLPVDRRHGYTLTDNRTGTTAECKNLSEVFNEIASTLHVKLFGETTYA
jgi:hypothetical protein